MQFFRNQVSRLRALALRCIRFLRISFLELRAESRSTVLGVFWIPLSSILFALVLSILFHPNRAGDGDNFFLYVLVGYSLWQFIAATINGSIGLLQSQLDNAVHNGLSLSGLYLKSLSDRFVELVLNLGTCFLAVLWLHPASLGATTMIVPAVLIALATSLAVSYLISLAVTFLPDLGRLIKTGTRFLFFASPVFWSIGATDQPIRVAIYSFNPVSYYLDIIRQAFGIAPLDLTAWAIAGSMSFLLAAAGWVAFAKTRTIVTNIK